MTIRDEFTTGDISLATQYFCIKIQSSYWPLTEYQFIIQIIIHYHPSRQKHPIHKIWRIHKHLLDKNTWLPCCSFSYAACQTNRKIYLGIIFKLRFQLLHLGLPILVYFNPEIETINSFINHIRHCHAIIPALIFALLSDIHLINEGQRDWWIMKIISRICAYWVSCKTEEDRGVLNVGGLVRPFTFLMKSEQKMSAVCSSSYVERWNITSDRWWNRVEELM